jgi:rhodanese-related sulfurtransferase
VDTRINTSLSPSDLFMSPHELSSRLGNANPPLLLDVRPQVRFDESTQRLAYSHLCPSNQIPAFAAALLATNPHQEVVVYCVYGHQVSAGAAQALCAAGLNAHALAGGFEGGEDGVDSAEAIAEWRRASLTKVAK